MGAKPLPPKFIFLPLFLQFPKFLQFYTLPVVCAGNATVFTGRIKLVD